MMNNKTFFTTLEVASLNSFLDKYHAWDLGRWGGVNQRENCVFGKENANFHLIHANPASQIPSMTITELVYYQPKIVLISADLLLRGRHCI